jgi:hypothetical protein
MKNILKLEELAMFMLALYLFSFINYPWWLFAVLFLTPDIGILGYLVNTKFGAFAYNVFHHKGIAILFYIAGMILNIPVLMFTGLLLFAHSSFDRIFGYGLKYSDNFKNNHLGLIGKNS